MDRTGFFILDCLLIIHTYFKIKFVGLSLKWCVTIFNCTSFLSDTCLNGKLKIKVLFTDVYIDPQSKNCKSVKV